MIKKIILTAIVLGLIGAGVGYYQYNRPVASLENATADFELTADQLVDSFVMDETKANETYLGKVLQVEGKVIGIEIGETTVVVLEGMDFNTIRAEMSKDSPVDKPLQGQIVKVKGSCSGFLMDVILNECVLINKK